MRVSNFLLNWQVSITSKMMELAIFIILPLLNYTAYTASKRLLSTEQDTELWLPDSIHYTASTPPPPTPNIIHNKNLITRRIMSICHCIVIVIIANLAEFASLQASPFSCFYWKISLCSATCHPDTLPLIMPNGSESHHHSWHRLDPPLNGVVHEKNSLMCEDNC